MERCTTAHQPIRLNCSTATRPRCNWGLSAMRKGANATSSWRPEDRRIRKMKTAVLFLALLLLIASSASSGRGATKTKLTQSEAKELVQAVQDEIYDYEYQGHFFPEGGPVGDVVSASRTRVSLYISPFVEDGEGQVIYKLMPYGEVLRLFHVHD